MVSRFRLTFNIVYLILTFFAISIAFVPESNPKELSAAPPQAPAEALWPQEKSDLTPDPAVRFGRLKNGFRYVLMKNHEPKRRVSLHLNVEAGSMQETDDQQGLAHFLEHMVFNGSTHFKPGELVEFFQSIGMLWGADANAHTGFTETVYDVLLPTGDRKSLDEGLTVLEDFAGGALLLPKEIDRERKVILAEKRSRDSASYRTFEKSMQFQFPDARISRRLPIGKETVIETAGQKRLKAFYDTWYRPEKLILVMVGDFDPADAEALIREKFSGLKARAPAAPPFEFGDIHHKGLEAFYHFEEETGYTEVSIDTVEKIEPRPDTRKNRQEQLLRDIADQMVQHRLDTLLRTTDAPFTSADIGSAIFLDRVRYASISAQTSPQNWEKTLAILEQTLRRALRFGFSADELKRVKKDLLTELETALRKAQTRDSQMLARMIIRSLNGNKVFLSPAQEKALFEDFIRNITPEDVQRALQAAWCADHRLVLVSGDLDLRNRPQPPESLIKAAYKASRATEVSAPVEKKGVAFPYLPVPAAKGKIVRKETIPDLGIIQVDFENGLRLNLKKTDFKAKEILFSLAFGQGRASEPADQPGLALMAGAVVNESGLGQMGPDELERALAGTNTEIGFQVQEDRFAFSGSSVPQETTLLFQLLYAQLQDPAFREDAWVRSLKRLEQEYLALSGSIEGTLRLRASRFLAGGDTRFGFPALADLQKRTLEQVKSWLIGPLEKGDLELSIVGDFDPEAVIATAATYLGSLPRNSGTKEVGVQNRNPKFPDGKALTVDVKTEIPKAMVVLAYGTDDAWDIGRNRRLSVLAEVFSERLRKTIREKLGATYSPFAYNRSSRAYTGYGVLKALVTVDPHQTEMVLKEIRAIGADLAQNGVTAAELELSLKPILTSLKDLRRTNSYWLQSVLEGSKEHPRQLEWSRSIMSDYAAITPKEVSALAARYLERHKAAAVTIRPSAETKS